MLRSTERRIQNSVRRKERRANKMLGKENACAEFSNRVQSKDFNRRLKEIEGYIRSMCALIKSYIAGEYTAVPFASIIAVLAALIYWVSPIDVISDFIPFVGYIDDLSVFTACLAAVKIDLDDYIAWKGDGEIIVECESESDTAEPVCE